MKDYEFPLCNKRRKLMNIMKVLIYLSCMFLLYIIYRWYTAPRIVIVELISTDQIHAHYSSTFGMRIHHSNYQSYDVISIITC